MDKSKGRNSVVILPETADNPLERAVRGGQLKRQLQRHGRSAVALPALGAGALTFGALAIGALAIGALAIGSMAIGRLAIGRLRLKHLDIDELAVRRFRIPQDSRAD
jgi:hypothetical protein